MRLLNKRKFLARLLNNRKNVNYNDFVTLVEAFGFRHMRADGSHNIYKHEVVAEIINIQNVKGEAKSYQIKQFLVIVEKYNLRMEEDGE